MGGLASNIANKCKDELLKSAMARTIYNCSIFFELDDGTTKFESGEYHFFKVVEGNLVIVAKKEGPFSYASYVGRNIETVL